MKYLTVKEASEKWGYSEATIRKWCQNGLIQAIVSAEKKNGHWQIPFGAQCPKRIKKQSQRVV